MSSATKCKHNLTITMSEIEENLKEIIALSDLIRSQEFRLCFITHFIRRAKELENIFSKIDIKILQRLQLKLLDPLLYHIGIRNNSKEKCVLVQGIKQILHITPIHSVCEFLDVYTKIFFQIFKGGNLPYKPSEELMEEVLECCTFLIHNTTNDVLWKVYSEEFAGQLSLGIFICVNIAKEERSIKLRIAALHFLFAASQFQAQGKYTNEIFQKVGDLFMLYLPGVLGPLLDIILRDETQHHLITAKALSCWGHILCVVMKDSAQNEIISDDEVIKEWMLNTNQTDSKPLNVKLGLQEKKRTKLWLESASTILHPLVMKLPELRKHSHPKCRLELTQVMVNILKNCLRNLKKCLGVAIEVLVSSSMDEDGKVVKVAEEALKEFESECNEKNICIFVDVVEENLYSIINKLLKIVQSGDEQILLPSLRSLSGYLSILGRLNRAQHLLSLSSTLKKFMQVVRLCIEIEIYPEIFDQDFSLLDEELSPATWCKPWKRFRHFADERIKTQLEEICQDVGKFGPTDTIFDFLLDWYDSEPSSNKEILFILNEVVSQSKEMENHMVDHLLDFYLEPQNLYPPLQANECVSLKEAQTNIIKVALIMEGIGKLAKRIGKKFQDYLLKTLYYVLERMGSGYRIIREAATFSAVQIATACDLDGNVKSLIQNNVDYLTYHLTIKLKRNEESVFGVMSVLIKNSPFETLPNLEEIIHSVLKSSSQNFNSPHTLSYLRLFQTFVFSMRKWMKTDRKHLNSKPPEKSDVERLVKYLEDVTKKEPEEEEEEEEEATEDRSESEIPEEPEKPELPRHLKLTVAIANHCLHYLASKDKDKKIIVLEILNECVWALEEWENELLPLVHNIWSPLVGRFDSATDPLIINRSFTLLCSLSFTSKDFIRRRTLKNVLPALESFLVKQSAKSKLKNSASGYLFTQSFKLQRELLTNLGKLTSSLGLFERETDLVVESALPYLSCLQPQELQGKCRILFEDLKEYDRYLVWFKIRHLAENPEFANNVKTLLNMNQ